MKVEHRNYLIMAMLIVIIVLLIIKLTQKRENFAPACQLNKNYGLVGGCGPKECNCTVFGTKAQCSNCNSTMCMSSNWTESKLLTNPKGMKTGVICKTTSV